VVSTIFVCNMSAATTIRIWVQKAGETLAAKQYLYYDLALNASETLAVTSGVTLANGDVLMVRAAAATVAFSAFGVETR